MAPAVVAYRVTFEPCTRPVSPRTPGTLIDPLATQELFAGGGAGTNEYFSIVPGVSSATYRVSFPTIVESRLAKKNPYGAPAVGKPGKFVIVWPLVVGNWGSGLEGSPTAPRRTDVPELSDTYNCPPKMAGTLRLATVVLSWVDPPAVPNGA